MRILHITSHLGGGVGKALSGLCKQAKIAHSENEHIIVCLEEPKDKQFFNKLVENRTSVIVQPEYNELEKLMESSDIVQVEFWNHPLLLKYLCEMNIPDIRLVVWCHINGLFNPIIPMDLIIRSHKFIHTYPDSNDYKNTGCVASSGGFEDFPIQKNKDYKELTFGYVGSSNFSKMNLDYSYFINETNIKVKFIGNLPNRKILETQTNNIEFIGFIPNIIEELKSINVLVYFLNPEHYGTTENILLETMSMGVVPIVLDNICEKNIITDNYNGIIIRKNYHKDVMLSNFVEKINLLRNNIDYFNTLGNNASKSVRKNFHVGNMEFTLNKCYNSASLMNKKKIDFKSIFGDNPSKWFMSCQHHKGVFKNDGSIDLCDIKYHSKPILFEESKGSVHHFNKYFPEDKLLKLWSDNMRLLQ